jgi:hypothetical protein
MGALYTPGTVVSSRPAVRCPAGTRRFAAASPCIPLEHSAWRDPNVTRHHQGFTHVHPSGLPLACDPRTEREPLGVFSELRTPPLPAAHVRAGTGPGHWPGITPSASAGLLPVNPHNLCDLVSHRPGVPRPQHDSQRLTRPAGRAARRRGGGRRGKITALPPGPDLTAPTGPVRPQPPEPSARAACGTSMITESCRSL